MSLLGIVPNAGDSVMNETEYKLQPWKVYILVGTVSQQENKQRNIANNFRSWNKQGHNTSGAGTKNVWEIEASLGTDLS